MQAGRWSGSAFVRALRPWTEVATPAIRTRRTAAADERAASAQSRRMLSLLTDMMCTEAQSENCLVLNIWEPVSPATNPRPVMVSLHGGAHTLGSGSMPVFDGASLASQHDVVSACRSTIVWAPRYLFLADVLGEVRGRAMWATDIVAACAGVHDNAGAFRGGRPT
ncbi:MAG: carboxylesterase family protein [Acidimicrobiales bacterium]